MAESERSMGAGGIIEFEARWNLSSREPLQWREAGFRNRHQLEMPMLAILPYLALFLIILTVYRFGLFGWRGSVLFGASLWGFIVVVITECLSAFRLITFPAILIVWSGVTLIMVILWITRKGRMQPFGVSSLRSRSKFEVFLLACIVIILVVIGFIAFLYPPNTWDSMTYHMSRVMHWIQNQSVEFFPTSWLPELHHNPWVEYAILHLQILNRGDFFANSVQWLSLIGCIVGVSLIAKELNASVKGQIFAAVFCATIPMAILQGSSTQNNLSLTFWLICFIYFIMRMREQQRFIYALGAGLSLGLCVLTKATAYIFALPFLAWFIVHMFVSKQSSKWVMLGTVAILAVTVNAGNYSRNYSLYRNPIGPTEEEGGYVYKNELYSLPAITSNIIRNISLQTSTPSYRVKSATIWLIDQIHRSIGLSTDDPRTTFKGTRFSVSVLSGNSYHESKAGNPWHFLLIICASINYLATRSKKSVVTAYLLLVTAAFLVFCIYLKWQPWHVRLHLPVFILFSPFIGVCFTGRLERFAGPTILFLFIILSYLYLFMNQNRPLVNTDLAQIRINRFEQYFNDHPSLMDGYLGAYREIDARHCANLGLMIGRDQYEYPLWMMRSGGGNGTMTITHVNVTNNSSKFVNDGSASSPCTLFTISSPAPAEMLVDGQRFIWTWSDTPYHLYFP